MQLSWSPSLANIARLLSQCDLPSGDIIPEYLPNFVIARDGHAEVGIAGLQILGTNALVRSIGVASTHRRRGPGSALLAAVEARARSQGVMQLYLLTNDAQAFVAAQGYTELPRPSAPAEIQSCSPFAFLHPPYRTRAS